MKKISALMTTIALTVSCLAIQNFAWARGNPDALPGQPSPQIYEQLIVEDVYLPMRDGVVMHMVVVRPDAEGRFPVILNATPYGVNRMSARSDGEPYASRGYVWVGRNVRGRYTSEGEFINLHLQELNDQYDSIDWLADQPWSNGEVGTMGKSYAGQTSLFAALSAHPALVCAQAQFTAENLWRDGWYYRGGAFEQGFLTNWATHILGRDTGKRILEPGPVRDEWLGHLSRFNEDRAAYNLVLPLTDFIPTQIGPDYNLLKTWLAHPSLDGYWAERNIESYLGSVNIPILHVASWYDCFLQGSIQTFLDIQNKGLSARSRENQRLFIYTQTHLGDEHTIDLGQARHNIPMADVTLAFFDYWLKDVQTPLFDPDKAVTWYTMGGQVWRSADVWPPQDVEYTNYYLSSVRNKSFQSLNNGSLSRTAPTAASDAQSYVYDPMQPIPTLGGNTLGLFAYTEHGSDKSGAQPQNYVDSVSLTYTTEPLAEPLEITGQVRAVLYVSSSAVDTDFIARVNDVHPDGTSHNIVDGILRGRYRDSSITPQLMTPGEVYEIEIDLWSTSHVFLPGHAIRVTINSSSFPRWSRNMNVAEQPEKATEWAVANNTIYMDAERPSHVLLPVISK